MTIPAGLATEETPASGAAEPLGDAAAIARLLGLPSWRQMNSLTLVDQIEQGIPLQRLPACGLSGSGVEGRS